jgi:hypothetical protein
VRDAGDEARLAALRAQATALGLVVGRDLVFTPNPTFDYLAGALSHAMVGLHSMRSEHFGINCVEMLPVAFPAELDIRSVVFVPSSILCTHAIVVMPYSLCHRGS